MELFCEKSYRQLEPILKKPSNVFAENLWNAHYVVFINYYTGIHFMLIATNK